MSEQTTQSSAQPSPESQVPEHHFQHEADKTELEKWVNAALTRMEPYSNQILLGFIGIAVVLVSGIVIYRTTSSSQQADWEKFVEYSTPEDFASIAEKHKDGSIAAWALLRAGKGYLQEGMRNVLTNREISDTRLQSAVDAFDKLLKNSDAPPKAREEALFGLATAQEVLEGGDPSSAVAAYKKIVDNFPESTHVAWAKQRIVELGKRPNQEFYAWFREQNPKPGDRALPSDLLQNISTPPAKTDLDLLQDPTLILPPTGTGAKNENTVPSDAEMKANPESAPKADTSPPAKPFPAPGEEAPSPVANPENPQPAKSINDQPAKKSKESPPETKAEPAQATAVKATEESKSPAAEAPPSKETE